MGISALEPFDQLGNGAKLIALDLEVSDKRELVLDGWHEDGADVIQGPNGRSYHTDERPRARYGVRGA